MSQATVEELMEELYALVEKAVKLPLSGGRTVLDGEEVKAILDEMRDHLPQETRQARAIVADLLKFLQMQRKRLRVLFVQQRNVQKINQSR
ncbi:MAG: hypothetical protein ACLR13_00285 [Acutalibacteraceae bacterium]